MSGLVDLSLQLRPSVQPSLSDWYAKAQEAYREYSTDSLLHSSNTVAVDVRQRWAAGCRGLISSILINPFIFKLLASSDADSSDITWYDTAPPREKDFTHLTYAVTLSLVVPPFKTTT